MKADTGKDAPKKVNAFIEIPKASCVKYEYDEESEAMRVDRILHTSMVYPHNYGFIPDTLGEDGDPLDIMVISSVPFAPGVLVSARPIGLLQMKDEAGVDTKIMAVPDVKIDPEYKSIEEVSDLAEHTRSAISHFFSYYKSLEPGKWVELGGWKGAKEARELILKSISESAEE